MDYFKRLLDLLKLEREQDRKSYQQLTESVPAAVRRAAGLTWYPVAIRDTELGRGEYLNVEFERTTNQDIPHQFRFGCTVSFFSNHNAGTDRVEGTVSHQSGNRIRVTLRTDELPEWSRNGKLGLDLLFDENSYVEMEQALKDASSKGGDSKEGRLVRLLTGEGPARFPIEVVVEKIAGLNESQQAAVAKIRAAEDLAIVYGPPGTGKTTTLVQAIKKLCDDGVRPILVVAPSNAAVDLLADRLSEAALNVVRVGNPARVSERLVNISMDGRMALHPSTKDIKKMKKQASEFKSMAHKYKRSFGPAERAQRKALFDEAHRIMKDVDRTEQYIIDDILNKAQIVCATPVGAQHYTLRDKHYPVAVIDEAGQALEPACWIPILKTDKLVLAGDPMQLPPTIKSEKAGRDGLATTLLEKCIELHPEAVSFLDTQYRMNEHIMGYSAKVFYKSELKAHASVAQQRLFPDDAPLLFIDTAGCGFMEESEGTSISNPEEAAFVVKHLVSLVTMLEGREHHSPSVAVISPYRQQVLKLEELCAQTSVLKALGAQLSVNTIDSFQGQERDVVYISLTRSNLESSIGFLSDIRRMNVAMTRARRKLVLIGDSATLSVLPFYAELIAYAEAREAYHSAWEFNL